ncbi:MAG: histidine phosphatase family protein [Proteobacteria bacterium]|nr:histidine phosphatase family protein [Pseudomonadota bacterium]
MRTLVFMRHAKSGGMRPGLTDFERPLTARGQKEAPAMARQISRRAVYPDLILSSPAVRAVMTARLVAQEMALPDHAIRVDSALYEALVDQYLDVIRTLPDDAQSVLLVGHNPTITDFINLLASSSIAEMPAGGIAAVEAELKAWSEIRKDCGKLLFFEHPARDGSR